MKTPQRILFICLFLSPVFLFAQRGTGIPEILPGSPVIFLSDKSIDTVNLPPVLPACAPNLAVGMLAFMGAPVSGTNVYRDVEKTQYYTYPGGGQITGALVFCEKKQGADGNTGFVAKVYAKGSNPEPAALLGTSDPVFFPALDTSSNGTLFTFNPPVFVSDSFFVSVVVDDLIPETDTLLIYTLFDGSNPVNDCGLNTAWELQADSTWHLMNGTTNFEWDIDVQFYMLPLIDNSLTGLSETTALSQCSIFPNPAREVVNIAFQLQKGTQVELLLANPAGQVVYRQTLQTVSPGAYNFPVDISTYTPGTYTYSVHAEGRTLSGICIVQ